MYNYVIMSSAKYLVLLTHMFLCVEFSHLFLVVVTSFPVDVSKCFHRPVFAVQFLHEDNAIVFVSSDFFHHLVSSELFFICLFHFLLDLLPHTFNTARVFPLSMSPSLCLSRYVVYLPFLSTLALSKYFFPPLYMAVLLQHCVCASFATDATFIDPLA